jgi:hypothetical protein
VLADEVHNVPNDRVGIAKPPKRIFGQLSGDSIMPVEGPVAIRISLKRCRLANVVKKRRQANGTVVCRGRIAGNERVLEDVETVYPALLDVYTREQLR